MSNFKLIPCEVFTRVVGFFRPISAWNKGKQSEFADRVAYKIPKGENDADK